MRNNSNTARITRIMKNKKGFTLVEMIVAILIFSLVLAMFYQFFGFSDKLFRKTDEIATMQDQARLIVQGVRKDIGTALAVAIVDSDLDTVVIPTDSYALYVQNDLLIREDHDGAVDSVYSNSPVQNFKIVFSSTDNKTVHVTIGQEGVGIPLAATDIYLENTTANTASTADGTGNIIVYKPSVL